MENERDAGLIRAVGTGALTANIVNSLVGAGIFTVPAALAASAGSYAPLAFLICAMAMGSIAICFAEGGSRVPTSGGAYGYIDEAFGPFVAFIAGTLLWLSDVLACGGLAAAVADVAASTAPAAVATTVRAVVIVGAIGAIAAINVSGVARGARLVDAATMVKLIPLGVFVIVGAGSLQLHGAGAAATAQLDRSGIGRALILALFALSGMEGAVSASGEVKNPARTIPRALATALISVTTLYIAVQLVAQGILGGALAQSSTPLADAMARVHPSLRILMLAGAGISMLGWLSSDVLGSPRILFAFARDGMMPRVLGRLHPRTHTPHVAILTYALMAIGLALTGTFAELAVLSTLAVAPLYIAACLAAWRLSRRGVARAGAPLDFAWLGLAAAIGIAAMITVVALASRAEIVGLIVVLALSALAYLVQVWVKGTPRRASGSVSIAAADGADHL